jgi:DNA-binding NarL/FixJ family response regulator
MKRILIVDDHAVVRDGLQRVLAAEHDEVEFGEASTINEALKLARQQNWDVAVLDLSLGSRSGLELLKTLKEIHPNLPVLVLSMHSEEQFARPAFKAGASGYLTKDSPRSELVKAINKVINGGKYISPALAENLITDLERGTDRPPHESLSSREFEVLRLIASGRTVTEIANLLSLSDRTISTYRTRLLEKMGMKTNAELTYYGIKNGLVE